MWRAATQAPAPFITCLVCLSYVITGSRTHSGAQVDVVPTKVHTAFCVCRMPCDRTGLIHRRLNINIVVVPPIAAQLYSSGLSPHLQIRYAIHRVRTNDPQQLADLARPAGDRPGVLPLLLFNTWHAAVACCIQVCKHVNCTGAGGCIAHPCCMALPCHGCQACQRLPAGLTHAEDQLPSCSRCERRQRHCKRGAGAPAGGWWPGGCGWHTAHWT